MPYISKYAQIFKIDTVVDEFQVKRSNYHVLISFKGFEVPPVPLNFSLPYLSLSHNPNIVRSPCILLREGNRKFIFHVECDETYACVGEKKYKLFMAISDFGDEDCNGGVVLNHEPKYVETLTVTECPCLKPSDSSCGNGLEATLLEMFHKVPVLIFRHTHNCLIQEIPGIICVKFSLIDTSRATMLPLKVLKMKAERNCLRAMEPILPSLEKILFDTKITTKHDDQLFAHSSILKARSPSMHSLVKLDDRPCSSTSGPPTMYAFSDQETGTFVMNVILHFINTGVLQEDWVKDMDGVITAARRYQLGELLQILEHSLVDASIVQHAQCFHKLARKHDFKNACEIIKNKYQLYKGSCWDWGM